MRRAAFWLWLCALALRLQPALLVSAAGGLAGRWREAGAGGSADTGDRTWRGRGSGDFPSSRASKAGGETRSPEIRALDPTASAVGEWGGAAWVPQLREEAWGVPWSRACAGAPSSIT